MSLHDRSYYRDDRNPDPGRGWGDGPRRATPRTGTWLLVVLNIGVFLVQVFSQRRGLHGMPSAGVTPYLDLDPRHPWELWRLITAGFCHSTGDLWHLVFNMVVLWWTGNALEQRYGRRELLAFYFAAEIASSVTYLVYCALAHSMHPAVGASGAVMGLFVLFALHYPRTQVLVMMVVPVEIRWLVLIYAVYDLHPFIQGLMGHEMETGVAHAGHLGGMVFGALYFQLGWRLTRWSERTGLGWPRWLRLPRLRSRATAAPFTLVEPRPAASAADREVDRILAKIAAAGEESLSPAERATLEDASRRYRENQNKPVV